MMPVLGFVFRFCLLVSWVGEMMEVVSLIFIEEGLMRSQILLHNERC